MKLRELVPQLHSDLPNISKWKKVGDQMGSNPGGVYNDHNGQSWYVKHSKSDDHAHNEILANKLYQHLGVPTLDHQLIKHKEGLGTASPMVHIQNFNPHSKDDISSINKHLGSHAFVANWDSIGSLDDNQARTHKGMTTLDAGGALNYRAQGTPKGPAFGHEASEFDSLRDHSKNPQAARIFGQMNHQALIKSVEPVAKFRNQDIHSLVHAHGPGNFKDKTELTDKLINRKKDLINRANQIAQRHGLKPLRDIDET